MPVSAYLVVCYSKFHPIWFPDSNNSFICYNGRYILIKGFSGNIFIQHLEIPECRNPFFIRHINQIPVIVAGLPFPGDAPACHRLPQEQVQDQSVPVQYHRHILTECCANLTVPSSKCSISMIRPASICLFGRHTGVHLVPFFSIIRINSSRLDSPGIARKAIMQLASLTLGSARRFSVSVRLMDEILSKERARLSASTFFRRHCFISDIAESVLCIFFCILFGTILFFVSWLGLFRRSSVSFIFRRCLKCTLINLDNCPWSYLYRNDIACNLLYQTIYTTCRDDIVSLLKSIKECISLILLFFLRL